MQVIIYTNDVGGVSLCIPSGEIPIEEVLEKDCPAGAIIVDDSTLPQDRTFFNAWELNGTTVTVNFAKSQAYKLSQFNAHAVDSAQKRQLNTLAGLPNTPDDATWSEELQIGRAAINFATTTEQLLAVAMPT
jgi:hypothetical protein